MNMSLLHAKGEGDHEGRYGQFRLGEDEFVVYDRENAGAWARVSPPASVDV